MILCHVASQVKGQVNGLSESYKQNLVIELSNTVGLTKKYAKIGDWRIMKVNKFILLRKYLKESKKKIIHNLNKSPIIYTMDRGD